MHCKCVGCLFSVTQGTSLIKAARTMKPERVRINFSPFLPDRPVFSPALYMISAALFTCRVLTTTHSLYSPCSHAQVSFWGLQRQLRTCSLHLLFVSIRACCYTEVSEMEQYINLWTQHYLTITEADEPKSSCLLFQCQCLWSLLPRNYGGLLLSPHMVKCRGAKGMDAVSSMAKEMEGTDSSLWYCSISPIHKAEGHTA